MMMNRTKIVSLVFLLLGLVGGNGCLRKPETLSREETPLGREILELTEGSAEGLWVATSDFQSGTLGRLDLKTGEMEDYLLLLGPDTRILPDPPHGLFLLTRREKDSLQVLRGKTADVVAERALPEEMNPQFALRDKKGRVWLVGLDSNQVNIFSPDLSQFFPGPDLSSLKDSHDPYAELSFLAPLDSQGTLMGVLAQRLKRGFIPPNWIPDSQAGLAVIDVNSGEVKKTLLFEAPNPLGLFPLGEQSFQLVASGDLSSQKTSLGKDLSFHFSPERQEITLARTTQWEGRILDAAPAPSGILAAILWNPDRKTSCVVYGALTLLCQTDEDQGYLFEKILVVGKVVFVSYRKKGESELWAIPLDGSPLKKIPMIQPVQSLSVGP